LNNRLADALKERFSRIVDDERRYWRLNPGNGRVFLAYLDPLKIIRDAGFRNRFIKLGNDVASVLGLVAALAI